MKISETATYSTSGKHITIVQFIVLSKNTRQITQAVHSFLHFILILYTKSEKVVENGIFGAIVASVWPLSNQNRYFQYSKTAFRKKPASRLLQEAVD